MRNNSRLMLSVLLITSTLVFELSSSEIKAQEQVLLSQRQSAKGFNVCNKTNNRLGALLVGSSTEGGLATFGWFQIQPKSCRNLFDDTSRIKAFLVNDDSSNGKVHTSEYSVFCISKGNPHKKRAFDTSSYKYQGCFEGKEVSFQKRNIYSETYTFTVN